MSIRLFVGNDLQKNQAIALKEGEHHYLKNVMRQRVGDTIYLFNGRDGEWQAEVVEIGKKESTLKILEENREQEEGQEIILVFAPIKQARLDWMMEKATELGVMELYPVTTDHSAVNKINVQRLSNIAKEAAEQSERLTVPTIHSITPLKTLLNEWPQDKPLYVCLERGENKKLKEALGQGPFACLIGPEGGFSEKEVAYLKNFDFVRPVSLGKQILRSETAAIVALGCKNTLG